MTEEKKQLEVFCGYPIFKIKTGETLNEDELKFFKSLTTVPHFEKDVSKIKLTNSDNILNNIVPIVPPIIVPIVIVIIASFIIPYYSLRLP